MSQSETIARPYAKAAYHQAFLNKTINQWQDFFKIAAIFLTTKEVNAQLSTPEFFSKFKGWLDEALLKNRGKAMQKEEINFLQLLYDNDRLSVLPDIENLFGIQVHQANNVCKAKVYTAKVLSEAQHNLIVKMLADKLNKEILLEVEEQPDLIAGIRIEYEGLVLDQSIKGRIEQFAQKLEDLRN